MSGGSFNYLCYSSDLEELLRKKDDLESMFKVMAELGYAEDAAFETKTLLDSLTEWENRTKETIGKLKEVWRAIEWMRSCDYTEDEVREQLALYRSNNI